VIIPGVDKSQLMAYTRSEADIGGGVGTGGGGWGNVFLQECPIPITGPKLDRKEYKGHKKKIKGKNSGPYETVWKNNSERP